MNLSNPIIHGAEASPLGQPVAYRDTYAPELLFPIARQLKREELGIAPDALPFVGEDLWNAYELSWLNLRGKPVVAIATFRVPADSPNLIESKSLKLYLNSCNQSRFADPAVVQAMLARDLSQAAGAPVTVTVEPLSRRPRRAAGGRGGDRDALLASAQIQLPGDWPAGLGHHRRALHRSRHRSRRVAALHRVVPLPQRIP
jgi:7-cyano-7-deazaguanine reductase